MALIDEFLPAFQFRERHALTVAAGPQALLDALLLPGATEDPLTRGFIAMRELPHRLFGGGPATRAERPRIDFGIDNFMRLGRDADRELVFGLIGRFWQADYGLVHIEQPELRFAGYFEPGLAKLVLNFTADPLPNGCTSIATETRVFCVDDEARRRFRLYWALIRPVSGLIRRRLLSRIGRIARTGVC